MSQKITPFLWFDDDAEEAVKLYTSVFPNARVEKTTRYTEGGPGPAGQVMTVEFELEGQRFVALNGGPLFEFNESVSFVVNCDTQEEIDGYWSKLTAGGGAPGQCGWLKDRFGLSWQIVPRVLPQLLTDRETSQRVMGALMKMTKLDIAELEAAAKG